MDPSTWLLKMFFHGDHLSRNRNFRGTVSTCGSAGTSKLQLMLAEGLRIVRVHVMATLLIELGAGRWKAPGKDAQPFASLGAPKQAAFGWFSRRRHSLPPKQKNNGPDIGAAFCGFFAGLG